MEYGGGGGLHTALAIHRYADKARGIVGLAAQMRCVAGRGNGCVAQIVRLAIKSVRKFSSRANLQFALSR